MFRNAEQIKEGDVVIYRTYNGEDRKVTVTYVSNDIKNGRAGFDGVIVGMENNPMGNVWGYCDQIVRYVSKVSA